jgi:hypothetical protein
MRHVSIERRSRTFDAIRRSSSSASRMRVIGLLFEERRQQLLLQVAQPASGRAGSPAAVRTPREPGTRRGALRRNFVGVLVGQARDDAPQQAHLSAPLVRRSGRARRDCRRPGWEDRPIAARAEF